MKKLKVLVVEKSPEFRVPLHLLLKSAGHEVEFADSVVGATLKLGDSGNDFNLVITNQTLNGPFQESGSRLAKIIRGKYPGISIILMSGSNRPEDDPSHRFLELPFRKERLIGLIDEMFP
jgi:CheY-like chemotaxis protein